MVLKEARKKSELTQTTLAKIVGCTQENISQIETGKAGPSKKTREKIESFFDTEIDWEKNRTKLFKLKTVEEAENQFKQFIDILIRIPDADRNYLKYKATKQLNSIK